MTSTIATYALRRFFGDTRAVDGIDLEVAGGEIYGFLGPNGAGKSTTVRMLCTLLTPTSGTATVAGFDVATDPGAVRQRIGVALQDAALDNKQTGRELLALQGRLYGLAKSDVHKRIEELLPVVDIDDAIDHRIGTYSGGMRRRLDLAAALVHDPAILFLDEPTTGLDPVSRVKVWDEVRRLNTEHETTIFLTTQYLEEADQLADRVGIIHRGRIAVEGTPAALKREVGEDLVLAEVEGDPTAARTVVESIAGIESVSIDDRTVVACSSDGAAALSPVAVALSGAGIGVRHLTLRTPTLDDVFLKVTGAHLEGGDAAEAPASMTAGQQ